jgi:uncharacterized protein YbjT (DUF2867 family)
MKGGRIALVAGATSFTGRALARQDPAAHGVELRLQVRPGSSYREKLGQDPRLVQVDVSDPVQLQDALRGCDCAIQLIGTVRARFSETESYETVDYGTTLKLMDAGRVTGLPHLLLVSSVGAGTGLGSYLAWKKKTEEAVREGPIPWTIVRPSALAGDKDLPERPAMAASSAFLRGLSDSPIGGAFALDLRPINIQVLARVLLELVKDGAQRKVLSGRHLWRIARERALYEFVR